METTIEKPREEITLDDKIRVMLSVFKDLLESFRDEAEKSIALLDVSVKTPLSEHIEKSLKRTPLEGMTNLSCEIDDQIKHIIEMAVIASFKINKGIIKGAYKTKTDFNDLHFCIVLNDDNIENRDKIFEFYETYELNERYILEKFPVYFQFVPDNLISKISTHDSISL